MTLKEMLDGAWAAIRKAAKRENPKPNIIVWDSISPNYGEDDMSWKRSQSKRQHGKRKKPKKSKKKKAFGFAQLSEAQRVARDSAAVSQSRGVADLYDDQCI